MKHFNKENINHIKKLITRAKRLSKKITTKEVKTTVWKMASNKALGKDNINVELIKYVPEEICKEIANVLNGIYERNDTRIKLGNCYSTTTSKAKKDTRASEKPQAYHLARSHSEDTVENLHKYDRKQDQQTSVPITECVQKIQKHHQCSMGPLVDGC